MAKRKIKLELEQKDTRHYFNRNCPCASCQRELDRENRPRTAQEERVNNAYLHLLYPDR